jgi:sec-independent protein translocase protein TatB
MFGIGMNEFLLVVLLAVVLIGPKQLPEVARGLAKLLAAFRRATADLRSAVSEEVNARPEFRELSKIRDELAGDMNKISDRARNYMEKEFQEEQRIAGSVERDVRQVGSSFERTVEEEAGKLDSAAAGSDGANKPTGPHVAATSHAPWNVGYSKFVSIPASDSEPAPASEPAGQGESRAGETSAQPSVAAAPSPPAQEAESPEDQYLKERERSSS